MIDRATFGGRSCGADCSAAQPGRQAGQGGQESDEEEEEGGPSGGGDHHAGDEDGGLGRLAAASVEELDGAEGAVGQAAVALINEGIAGTDAGGDGLVDRAELVGT